MMPAWIVLLELLAVLALGAWLGMKCTVFFYTSHGYPRPFEVVEHEKKRWPL